MERQQSSSSFFPISSMILILAAAGGAILYTPALENLNPNVPSAGQQSLGGMENVEARLWQDPFFVLSKHEDGDGEEEGCKVHSMEYMAWEIYRRLKEIEEIGIAPEESGDSDDDSAGNAPENEPASGEDTSSQEVEPPEQNALTRFIKAPLSGRGNPEEGDDAQDTATTDTNDQSQESDSPREAKIPPQLTLLPVLVPGGSYSEDAETRRRLRIAVLSGLGIQGFVPESSDRIGFIETEMIDRIVEEQIPRHEKSTKNFFTPLIAIWKSISRCEAESKSRVAFHQNIPLTIPFEWFERTTIASTARYQADHAVLVLWLDESRFADGIMLRLDAFFRILLDKAAIKLDEEIFWDSIHLRLIGPVTSTTLLKMMEQKEAPGIEIFPEQHTVERIQERDPLSNLAILSPRATASRNLLMRWHEITQGEFKEEDYHKDKEDLTVASLIRKKWNSTFVSTICRDNVLAGALVEELKRRGLDLDKDHIILIGEWDTFYGRALPYTLMDEISAAAGWSKKKHIHRFAYLAGLGGSAPSQAGAGKEGRSSKESKTSEPAGAEQPYGPNQLDYTRRLAKRLQRLKGRLDLDKDGEIRAVGVLGSDVYDKQLVLQALRKDFPNAIFFTTDLDARLLHSSQYDWSRNLVVASAYGLELGKDYQKAIPAFRDSYQTSTFLACRLAMNTDLRKMFFDPADDVEICDRMSAQIFEISRNGVVNLTPNPDDQLNSSLYTQKRAYRDEEDLGFLSKNFTLPIALWFLASLAALPILWWATRWLFFRRTILDEKETKILDRIVTGAALSFLILFILIKWNLMRSLGEPFVLLEGVSIWPTEFVRLLVIFFCIYFIAVAAIRIKRSNAELEKAFITRGFAEADPIFPKDPGKQAWSWIGGVTKELLAILWSISRLQGFEEGKRKLKEQVKPVIDWWEEKNAIKWSQELDERNNALPDGSLGKNDPDAIWEKYRQLDTMKMRAFRITVRVIPFLLIAFPVVKFVGNPHIPFRGDIAFGCDLAILIMSIVSFAVLTFFVVDTTKICIPFIRSLASAETEWPASSTVRTLARRRGLNPEDIRDYIDMQVITKRTEVVGELICYPFIALLLMILSRLSVFDNWNWPWPLIAVIAFMCTIAVINALSLRRAAEKTRKESIRRLREKLSRLESGGKEDRPASARIEQGGDKVQPKPAQIEMLIEEIQSLQGGAFTPWAQNPVLRAVILPFGGVGAVALLDMLAQLGL